MSNEFYENVALDLSDFWAPLIQFAQNPNRIDTKASTGRKTATLNHTMFEHFSKISDCFVLEELKDTNANGSLLPFREDVGIKDTDVRQFLIAIGR